LFILIDGLDEFDGGKDQQNELLTFLMSLSKSETVKICVSSRHYPEFQNAFECFPRLRLEDLTRDDIKTVVEDRLGALSEFKLLQQVHPQASTHLISNVVQKAQGVFLWVYLVVRSLRQGVIDGDSMAALTRRLEEIPDDLDTYFQRIIDAIPRQQRKYAARYFRIMLSAKIQPSLLSLFFIEEEPDFVEKTPLEAADAQVIEARQRTMERRLESRCRGLLEAKTYKQSRFLNRGGQVKYYVDFLHRSVRDFLLSKETQSTLNECSPEDFDADEFLCKAALVQLKMAVSQSVDVRELSGLFLDCMRQWERSSREARPKLFETFTTVLKHHCPDWQQTPESYVALALMYRVERYAIEVIRARSLDLRPTWGYPLLGYRRYTLLEYSLFDGGDYSLRYSLFDGGEYSLRSVPLEAATLALLENGADPNSPCSGRSGHSIWGSFLDSVAVRSSTHGQLEPAWARIARAFVMNGAARRSTGQVQLPREVVAGKGLTYTSELKDLALVVERMFGDHEGKEIADILRQNSSTLGRVKRIFARSGRS